MKRHKSSESYFRAVCNDALTVVFSFCDLLTSCSVRLASRRLAYLLSLSKNQVSSLTAAWGHVIPQLDLDLSSGLKFTKRASWKTYEGLRAPLYRRAAKDLLVKRIRDSISKFAVLDAGVIDRWEQVLIPSIKVHKVQLVTIEATEEGEFYVDCELEFSFGDICDVSAHHRSMEEGLVEYPNSVNFATRASGSEPTLFTFSPPYTRGDALPDPMPASFPPAFWDRLGVPECSLAWGILQIFVHGPRFRTRKVWSEEDDEEYVPFSPTETDEDEQLLDLFETLVSSMPPESHLEPPDWHELPFRQPAMRALRSFELPLLRHHFVENWLKHALTTTSASAPDALVWTSSLIPSTHVTYFHSGISEGNDGYFVRDVDLHFRIGNIEFCLDAWTSEECEVPQDFRTTKYGGLDISIKDSKGVLIPDCTMEEQINQWQQEIKMSEKFWGVLGVGRLALVTALADVINALPAWAERRCLKSPDEPEDKQRDYDYWYEQF